MHFREAFVGQCSTQNLLFDYEPREHFVKSQWQKEEKSWLWLVWRWTCALFFLANLFATLITGWGNGKWFIYLTDWGFLMVTLSHCVWAAITTFYHFTLKTEPVSVKIFWLIHYVSSVSALFISFMYWTLVFPDDTSKITNYINWVTHASNSWITIIDILLSAHPLRLLHVLYTILFELLYVMFMYIYYFLGGTDVYGNRYIYKVLDFSRPRMSLMVQLASILGTVAIAVIYQLLFMLRLYIYSRTNRRDQQQSSPPPPSSEEPPSKKKNKV